MKTPRERAAEGLQAGDRFKAEVRILNAEDITVLEATTCGVLPSAEERERLSQMLLEGDPANGAARFMG